MEKQKWQQVAKQQCSTSDSLLQRAAPTHPTRAQAPDHLHRPAPGSLGLAQARGDSSWKASGSLWDYSSAICNSRCSPPAWVAPCCIHPSPRQRLRWVGSINQRRGQGGSIKGSPSQHSRHNMMRQAQSGCSAGQSFNRLNNSISTDH